MWHIAMSRAADNNTHRCDDLCSIKQTSPWKQHHICPSPAQRCWNNIRRPFSAIQVFCWLVVSDQQQENMKWTFGCFVFFFVFFLILYSSSQVFREWMGGETLALGVTSSEWCYTNKASLVKNLEEKHNLMYVEEAFFSILSFYCAGPYFIFLASPSLLCAFE